MSQAQDWLAGHEVARLIKGKMIINAGIDEASRIILRYGCIFGCSVLSEYSSGRNFD